jgi:hypothetical protein
MTTNQMVQTARQGNNLQTGNLNQKVFLITSAGKKTYGTGTAASKYFRDRYVSSQIFTIYGVSTWTGIISEDSFNTALYCTVPVYGRY